MADTIPEGKAPETVQKAAAPEGGEEKGGEGVDKGTKVTPEPKAEDTPEDPEKHTIPTRKSAASFIIERKNAKIQKLQKKEVEKPNEPEDEPEAPEEEPELTPQAKAAIQQELAPILERQRQEADDKEVAEYLSKNPEYRKYEPLARKYMNSKGYEAVPVEMIFNHLTAKDAERRGAEKALKALEEAKKDSAGANSAKVEEAPVDFSKMTPAEFKEYQKQNGIH